MKITEYDLSAKKPCVNLTLALVADLHTQDPAPVIDALKKIKPELILSSGDMFECFEEKNNARNEKGWEFFREALKIAPVFYCFGNHETEGKPCQYYPEVAGYKNIPEYVTKRLSDMGVHMLFDTHTSIRDGIHVGGLVSAENRGTKIPDTGFLCKFEKLDGYKILICHHPEYYPKYLSDKNIDIILSGHAHGGQWRIFGRGIYAPSQGIFPKYTSGIYDGKLIVSRGCGNYTRPIRVPRIFNPTEVLSIHITSDEK